MKTIARKLTMGPARHETRHKIPARGLIVVGCIAALPIAALAAAAWLGASHPANSGIEKITDFMPRQEVESILGTGTVVATKIEYIGTSPAKIETLEWQTADGQQRIRIEFVDDQVLRKTLSED